MPQLFFILLFGALGTFAGLLFSGPSPFILAAFAGCGIGAAAIGCGCPRARQPLLRALREFQNAAREFWGDR